ncbi:MAG: glutamate decarboxylase [Cyanobacteria bacterium P01_H01_bin.15]
MPLFEKNSIRENLNDDIYASTDLSVTVPKYKFPQAENDPRHVYQIIHDELMLDGNSRLNLATFCQTWAEEETHKLMDECLDKNMIDKDEYPQTAEIEARCVHMLSHLWNSPTATNPMGCSTTGSSEAAMLGGLAAKWRWRERMKKAGKTPGTPNIVFGSVQVCWHKFTRYFEVEERQVPLEPGRTTMTPEKVREYIDENTIAVVPTLGLTMTLQYENVAEISRVLDEYEAETGIDIPIHVDGASGGFIAPFIHSDIIWDFRLPRVKSINASGHKFGLAPLGAGWIVWREATDLPEDLVFPVNYLGGDMPTFALNFSRPGGQIVSQYYNFLRLGREGYAKIHQSCADTATYFAQELDKMGPFEIIYGGQGGIPGVCWTLKSNVDTHDYTLYDLSDRLRYRGWQVPAYSLPPDCEDMVVMRILVRHGVSKDLVTALLADIATALDYFNKHPISNPLTSEEATSYHH